VTELHFFLQLKPSWQEFKICCEAYVRFHGGGDGGGEKQAFLTAVNSPSKPAGAAANKATTESEFEISADGDLSTSPTGELDLSLIPPLLIKTISAILRGAKVRTQY
jgi:hypothetical protein